jgi:hypothetical protein
VIAFTYVGDFLPHVGNDAAALMSETHWPRQPRVAQLVHLRKADTTSDVTDRDLVRARIRDVDFLDHQRSCRLYLYCGLALHDRPLRSIQRFPRCYDRDLARLRNSGLQHRRHGAAAAQS